MSEVSKDIQAMKDGVHLLDKYGILGEWEYDKLIDAVNITLERLSGVQVDLIRDGVRAAQHKELRKKGRE